MAFVIIKYMDCKPFLSSDGKFIYLRPKPLFNKISGLKVYLKKEPDVYGLPIATTDILKGKTRYYLPEYIRDTIDHFEVVWNTK